MHWRRTVAMASNMGISAMNAQYADAFHEWTIPDKTPVHQNANLKKYRKAHNLNSAGLAGKVPLKKNSEIRNHMAQYDYYREQLPPGIIYPNLATNTVAAQPVGTLSQAVGNAVDGALAGVVADVPLTAGIAAALPVYGGTPTDYFMTAMGRWDTIVHGIVDILTPRDAQPRKMNVVRWQNLHETNFWNDFYGRGSGNQHPHMGRRIHGGREFDIPGGQHIGNTLRARDGTFLVPGALRRNGF